MTTVKCTAALALFLVTAVPSWGQTLYVDEQFDADRVSGVIFGTGAVESPPGEIDLRLELFEPVGVGVPDARPAILLVHGGGFVAGSRNEPLLIEACERMARRGYTCVSIDYRLDGDDPVIVPPWNVIEIGAQLAGFPLPTAVAAATEDAWTAHQWMVANADALGIDPARIGVGGTSAGAGTSLLLGYVLNKFGIAPPGSVAAVFDMWGSMGDPALMVGTDAPLLVAHGANDGVVPVADALGLEARALEVGLPHEVHIVAGAGHGFDIFTQEVAPGDTMFDRFVAFFAAHVAPPPPDPPVDVPALSEPGDVVMLLLFLGAAVAVIRGRSLPLPPTEDAESLRRR